MAPTTPSDVSSQPADTTAAAPSAEEIAAVVTELEQYRARLVDDFATSAKKAKLPKSMAMAQLKSHPEILKIDTALAKLRGEASPAAES